MIFCIGRNRTGTSSLAKALDILGFPCFHDADLANTIITLDLDEDAIPLSTKKYRNLDISHYKAFGDHPFDWMYHRFDKWYPKSKFIFTERNIEDYVKSKVFLLKAVRGQDYQPDREKLSIDYENHLWDVRMYFKHRLEDILFINICAGGESGDRWDKLCRFLGVKVPDKPFPHVGKRPPHCRDGKLV